MRALALPAAFLESSHLDCTYWSQCHFEVVLWGNSYLCCLITLWSWSEIYAKQEKSHVGKKADPNIPTPRNRGGLCFQWSMFGDGFTSHDTSRIFPWIQETLIKYTKVEVQDWNCFLSRSKYKPIKRATFYSPKKLYRGGGHRPQICAHRTPKYSKFVAKPIQHVPPSLAIVWCLNRYELVLTQL